MIHVVGGCYREVCLSPEVTQFYGSAGRAASAIAARSSAVTLHTMAGPRGEREVRRLAALGNFDVRVRPSEVDVSFGYIHPLQCSHVSPMRGAFEADARLHIDALAGTAALSQAPSPEWWPYRNQLLITMAAAIALPKEQGIQTILIGSVLEDRLNGDGSPEFRRVLDALLQLQEGNIGVDAPAADLTAADLVRKSGIPPGVLGWTHSCFVSDTPCLRCRGCTKHLDVLTELGC